MFIQTVYLLVAFFMVDGEPAAHEVYGQYMEEATCSHMSTHLVEMFNTKEVGQKYLDAGVENIKVACVAQEEDYKDA